MVLNILIIKSPEERAITKQACRNESVVFFLFPIFIHVVHVYSASLDNTIKILSVSVNFICDLR